MLPVLPLFKFLPSLRRPHLYNKTQSKVIDSYFNLTMSNRKHIVSTEQQLIFAFLLA